MAPDLSAHLQQILGSAVTLERELGGGGMSRVFVAVDHALARRVVVKVLPPEMAAAVNAERFRREIQLAASLQHPHIVPVLSAGSATGVDGEVLYYTMPFVEGESLRGLLARHRELPVPEAIRLLREIADALAYAHDRGVVHRDIKPENILLTTGHALVADFGIARALSAATAQGALTSVGVAVGTPAYMAPEQAAADPLTDHRADLYALGVVAYELLVGHPPFHGMAPQQMLAAHAMTRPEHVATRRAAVPAPLAALVMQLLEKRPADRVQSAHEVMRALEAIGSGASTAPTVTRRVGWRFGVGMVAALVVVAVTITVLIQRRTAAAPATLDANLVAVAPFRVSGDGSLAYLREGMLDLLSARLTGEGGPRAADPRTLLSSWRRRAGDTDTDLAESDALELASQLGAGQLLLGSIVATPPRLALHASLVAVPSGAVHATADAEGPGDSLGVLVDRLAAELLARRAGEGERFIGALAHPPLPVLRLYLEGMADSRRGQYPQAQRSLQRVLEMDSTFLPAAIALVTIQGYHPIDDERAWELVLRGQSSLSARDRALIEPRRRFVSGHSYASVIEAAEHHVTMAPDRAEAWTDLGEWLNEFGPLMGMADARARARRALTRARELDPDFVTPIRQLIRVEIEEGDTARVRALWALYQARGSESLEFETARWRVAHALADSSALRSFRASIPSLPPRDLLRILEAMQVSGVGLTDAPAVVQALDARAVDEYDVDRGGRAARALVANGGRGEEELPARFRDPAGAEWRDFDQVLDALAWDGDTTLASRSVERLLRLGITGRSEVRQGATCAATLWFLTRGDTSAVPETLRRSRDLLDARTAGEDDALPRLCGLTIDAMLEDLRGKREAAALTRLDSALAPGREDTQLFNLVASRLHESRGDIAGALAAVRRRSNHGRDGPTMLSTLLHEEGRLAVLAGDVDGAMRAYRHFLALRPDPVPRLRPGVLAVQAELARLTTANRGQSP